MSRIGKIPVPVPQGVKTAFNAGVVTIEGPKGKMEYKLVKGIEASLDGSDIVVKIGGFVSRSGILIVTSVWGGCGSCEGNGYW